VSEALSFGFLKAGFVVLLSHTYPWVSGFLCKRSVAADGLALLLMTIRLPNSNNVLPDFVRGRPWADDTLACDLSANIRRNPKPAPVTLTFAMVRLSCLCGWHVVEAIQSRSYIILPDTKCTSKPQNTIRESATVE